VLWVFAKAQVLAFMVIAAVIYALILWVRFAQRHPLVAIAIVGFMQGLCGGGRRWRRW
jgi:hypothetical protein